MRAPELRAVAGAKETYSTVCGFRLLGQLPGSLTRYCNSAFYHTNSMGRHGSVYSLRHITRRDWGEQDFSWRRVILETKRD